MGYTATLAKLTRAFRVILAENFEYTLETDSYQGPFSSRYLALLAIAIRGNEDLHDAIISKYKLLSFFVNGTVEGQKRHIETFIGFAVGLAKDMVWKNKNHVAMKIHQALDAFLSKVPDVAQGGTARIDVVTELLNLYVVAVQRDAKITDEMFDKMQSQEGRLLIAKVEGALAQADAAAAATDVVKQLRCMNALASAYQYTNGESLKQVFRRFRDAINRDLIPVEAKDDALMLANQVASIIVNQAKLRKSIQPEEKTFVDVMASFIKANTGQQGEKWFFMLILLIPTAVLTGDFSQAQTYIQTARMLLQAMPDLSENTVVYKLDFQEAEYHYYRTKSATDPATQKSEAALAVRLYQKVLHIHTNSHFLSNTQGIEHIIAELNHFIENVPQPSPSLPEHYYSRFTKFPDDAQRKAIEAHIYAKRFQEAINCTQAAYGIGNPGIVHQYEPKLGAMEGVTYPNRTPRIGPSVFAKSFPSDAGQQSARGLADIILAVTIAHEDTHRIFFRHIGYIAIKNARVAHEQGHLSEEDYECLVELSSKELALSEIIAYQSEIYNINVLMKSCDFKPEIVTRLKHWIDSATNAVRDYHYQLNGLDSELTTNDMAAQMQFQSVTIESYADVLQHIRQQIPAHLTQFLAAAKSASLDSGWSPGEDAFTLTSYSTAQKEYLHACAISFLSAESPRTVSTYLSDNIIEGGLVTKRSETPTKAKHSAYYPSLLATYGVRENKATAPRVVQALDKIKEALGQAAAANVGRQFEQWAGAKHRHFRMDRIKSFTI